jgi:hypothetical protein
MVAAVAVLLVLAGRTSNRQAFVSKFNCPTQLRQLLLLLLVCCWLWRYAAAAAGCRKHIKQASNSLQL